MEELARIIAFLVSSQWTLLSETRWIAWDTALSFPGPPKLATTFLASLKCTNQNHRFISWETSTVAFYFGMASLTPHRSGHGSLAPVSPSVKFFLLCQ